LHFGGGSIKAAILVWAGQHKETCQQDLLLGPDRTQLPHTISNDCLVSLVLLEGLLHDRTGRSARGVGSDTCWV
jgi:hypothetical protein